ncbi:hypothetical protein WA1_51200 [Scytonema hofmannii PCC 7110]|uniref:SH3b domain-containing protein n=1 Tax=Scytonema hofmannii PCC 7110 TaxID=128403 RepID=A0A139WQ72_9CYAN|nr:SH3 domain-containing protein [Scytonema hofmannii]KYC34574.1 hypothetical protein WA1_51200 [Scytonema hofmannii PCC 7110]
MNSSSNPTNKQQGSIFENVKFTGGDSSTFNVGNTTQNVYQQQKLDFFEPNLEQYQPPKFISPQITSSLIEIINQQRLLVLGGSPDVDKAALAKHLAWCLKSTTPSQQLKVKEWYRSSDPQSIEVELRETQTTTVVFVLTQLSPQNIVGYNLSRVQSNAAESPHYVIVTTDTPFAAWRLPESARSFWQELEVEDVADSENLINKLPKESIHNWYYHQLNPREQLLAIGLSFFDGLFDDQFFAALEEVVESVWQRRDTSLRALDYCDLDNLRSFFNFTETTTQRTIVEVRFPKQRQILFKVAWGSHRRQILAALPILVNLVKNSVRHFERELYGSSVRCDQIRRVISETISDIGLIASDAVEDALLNIAADENITVQTVAAQAMASWRDDEKKELVVDENKYSQIDQQLFETLQRWQHEARINSLVDAILKKQDQEKSEKPLDYIRATIALTVSYAALYDPPDELSPKLCDLLKQLVSELNQLVRNRVFTHTLPRVVPQHLVKLRSILRGMLRVIDDSVLAVADSLALAYRFRPNDVLETLNLWNSECKRTRPERVLAKVTPREALLATVALTYGKIKCDQRVGPLTVQQAVEHLQNILSEELHPRVREVALFAIGLQAYRAFEQVEPQLQDLISEITQKERQEVADILTEIYLDQRAKLRNGDKYIEVDKKQYPVWLNSTRPSTSVERAMLRWAKNDQNAMAQQVATHASANFVKKLEQEEERQIKQLREGRDPLEREPKPVYADPIIVGGQPPQDWYLGKLIPWLATRNAENYRAAIRNLLPEGLRQRQLSREIMNFVLRKWNDAPDNDVKTISGRLKPGLWLAENLGWLAALGVGGVLTLVGVAAINLSKSPTITPSEPVAIDPSITISDRASVSDVDSLNFNTGKLTVRFSAGGTSDDRLSIRNQGKDVGQIGVSGSEVTYSGTVIGLFQGSKETEPMVINLNSNATLEAVQALLRNITYQNVANSVKLGLRIVEFQITDDGGIPSRKPLTRSIFVTNENTAPTLIAPNRQAVKENTSLSISGISINDPDSTRNFIITLSVNNGTIAVKDSILKGLTASDISNNNTKTVKIAGSSEKIKATLADSAAILYKGTNDDNLKIEINDGGKDIPANAKNTLVWPPKAQEAKTNSKDIQIAVNPANKTPVISISEPSKTVNEDENLTITGISIDDPDSPNLTVTLGVEHGTLTIKTNVNNGLVFSDISGNKTGTVTLTGSIAKIKTTLADSQAITYRGIQDFNGNDSLIIAVDDKGRGKTNKLNIVVNSVNDPPVLSISASINTPKQKPEQLPEASPSRKPVPNPFPSSNQNNNSTNATIAGEPGSKNIRSGPGTDYEKRHTAYPGDRIQIIGRGYDKEGYLWYKVYFPLSGAEGWIAGQLVKVDANAQPAP